MLTGLFHLCTVAALYALSGQQLPPPSLVVVVHGDHATGLYHRATCKWLVDVAAEDKRAMAPDEAVKRHFQAHCACITGKGDVPPCDTSSPAAASTSPPQPSRQEQQRSVELRLIAQDDEKTFLGCLSCGQYDSDSVFNKYGRFGSKYSTTSIANKYGSFGGKYSSHSPCNPYTSTAPLIVDGDGKVIGTLTVNKYASGRIRDEKLLTWLAAMCAD